MLFEQFQHPNGQLPAYEWEFSDLNPPVHPWAVWRVYNMDRIRSGAPTAPSWSAAFTNCCINFTWWINKVDSEGNNVFEGGFLGLDNITLFDRRSELPGGAVLEQSDATGWMGMFCLNMMRIALELAKENKTYEGLATKFFQHYIYIGAAMKKMGGRDYNLWDERDGFFYDVLRYPDGQLPEAAGALAGRADSVVRGRAPRDEVDRAIPRIHGEPRVVHGEPPGPGRALRERPARAAKASTAGATIVDQNQLEAHARAHLRRRRIPVATSAFAACRSASRAPVRARRQRRSTYEPGEAESKIKGGNSNWRGPVWFPTAFLMIESLRKLAKALRRRSQRHRRRPRRRVDASAKSRGAHAKRLIAIFTRNGDGRRPVYGGQRSSSRTIRTGATTSLFYEYFHGDTGVGSRRFAPDRLDRTGRFADRRVERQVGGGRSPGSGSRDSYAGVRLTNICVHGCERRCTVENLTPCVAAVRYAASLTRNDVMLGSGSQVYAFLVANADGRFRT